MYSTLLPTAHPHYKHTHTHSTDYKGNLKLGVSLAAPQVLRLAAALDALASAHAGPGVAVHSCRDKSGLLQVGLAGSLNCFAQVVCWEQLACFTCCSEGAPTFPPVESNRC